MNYLYFSPPQTIPSLLLVFIFLPLRDLPLQRLCSLSFLSSHWNFAPQDGLSPLFSLPPFLLLQYLCLPISIYPRVGLLNFCRFCLLVIWLFFSCFPYEYGHVSVRQFQRAIIKILLPGPPIFSVQPFWTLSSNVDSLVNVVLFFSDSPPFPLF